MNDPQTDIKQKFYFLFSTVMLVSSTAVLLQTGLSPGRRVGWIDGGVDLPAYRINTAANNNFMQVKQNEAIAEGHQQQYNLSSVCN